MKMKSMNKKGQETVFTWIVAYLLIFLILTLFLIIVFAIKGKDKATGFLSADAKLEIERSNIDVVAKTKLLNFLKSKVLINGKEEKIIDVIKTSSADDNENFKKVMKALNDRCFTVSAVFLEIPQGIITTDGLVRTRNELESRKIPSVSLNAAAPPYYYNDPNIHYDAYQGRDIEIRAGFISGQTHTNKIDVWGNCKW